jgi:hypothetical protein
MQQEIEKLITDMQKEHFVAVPEMLRSADAQQCSTPHDYEMTKSFLVMLGHYYTEIRAVLQAIQKAALVLKTKKEAYERQPEQPNLESLGDL